MRRVTQLTRFFKQNRSPLTLNFLAQRSFAQKETSEQLKQRLTPLSFYVTQEKGTERAFTGDYYNHKEKGIYSCVVCGDKLFQSSTKYDSGSGWPSFYDCEKGKVDEEVDKSYGMVRREIHCTSCNSHLGHVFEDGPKPTGLRYCVNSASLEFKPDENDSKK